MPQVPASTGWRSQDKETLDVKYDTYDKYGNPVKGGAYANCHECGKAALLRDAGRTAVDGGSVCQGCYEKLQTVEPVPAGASEARRALGGVKRAKPTKRQVESAKNDLVDLLKELES